jgi:hypothetical protein
VPSRRATARGSARNSILRAGPAGDADAAGDFANARGKRQNAGTAASSRAKNTFRDELRITGAWKWKKSRWKQGSGVSLVNQNFRRNFPIRIN